MGTTHEKSVIEISPLEKYVAVTWQVNNFCNYSCSYCNPGNYSGANRNEGRLTEYLANLQEIVDRYTAVGYKHFKFFFSGGEPTAWENFIPICEWIREEVPGASIAVNTNLSRPLNWWKKHYQLFDDIVASFHVEFADKEKWLEKNVFLCDKMNYMATKLLMHEERFWEIVEYADELKAAMPNYFIEWTPLYDELTNNAGPWEYKDQAKVDFLATHTIESQRTVPQPWNETKAVSLTHYDNGDVVTCNSNDLIVNRQNFFTGWDCDVGDCVFINPVGDITMASCGATPVIGNILEDINNVGPQTISCPKLHCYCGTDIIIPKRKVGDNNIIAIAE